MRLNFEKYRDKVKACWIGKNIGGTLGGPYECKREVLDVKGFSTKAGEPLPNDDLDLQLVWLLAMERVGAQKLDAAVLGDYWTHLITPHWNEYGIGKANLKRGLLPPLSGDYNNDWKHSNGAWIRTEIWACLCPALPAEAVRFAVEDAMVDHGTGEGTVAAAFVAAMQSAAFAAGDVREAIEVGLAAIPDESRTAKSIRLVFECYEQGISPVDARNRIQQANADIGDGWFEAPSNIAYAILGMIYGEGDFKKSMLLAVNCGDDTDCTAATVGATLGILGGTAAIPSDWSEYIGDGIITISISMGVVSSKMPKTCSALTERVVSLAPAVIKSLGKNLVLGRGEDDIPEDIISSFVKDPALRAPIAALVPNSAVVDGLFMKTTVIYCDGPEISPLQEKKIQIRFANKHNVNTGLSTPHNLTLRWLGEGELTAESRTAVCVNHVTSHSDGVAVLDVTVRAGEKVSPVNRLVLEVVDEGEAQVTYIPVVFLG